jgi:hypothetical protein
VSSAQPSDMTRDRYGRSGLALALAFVLIAPLITGCHGEGTSAPLEEPTDASAGGTTATANGGVGNSETGDGDDAETVCQTFCNVAYMCPYGVPCPDESCHDFEYCESDCEGQRALADDEGCEFLIDVYYVCASQQTEACEAEDPTKAFNLPCSEELNHVFDCYNASEGP